ncbi:MAG: AAA family ATPase [Wenzhouxiangella sp.]|nr:MAG: AAA family ATPase [Wenzhouxiangella sp.]
MAIRRRRPRSRFASEEKVLDVKPSEVPVHAGFEPRLRLWLLRMLCDLGVAWSEDFNRRRFVDDTRSLLPVPDELVDDQPGLVRYYREVLESHRGSEPEVDGVLASNLSILGNGLRMGRTERDVLAFLLIYDALPYFEHVVDIALARTDAARATWQLSAILGVSNRDMEQAFSHSSVLLAAGLVQINEGMNNMPLSMVMEANRRVTRLLTHVSFEVNDLLHYAARAGRRSSLVLEDFEHMTSQRDLVANYLAAVQRDRVRPASLLFDGPPGVGKTELARLLAAQLGFNAWEINELDSDGAAARPDERIQFLRICQRLVERSDNPLIIFDEADAVIGGSLDHSSRAMGNSKAAMIHHLENLKVPVIWITNYAELIDPAIQRRFDLHVRFRQLPEAARKRMLDKAFQGVEGKPEWLTALGREKRITPARIAQADRVARLIAGDDASNHDRLLRQVLHENLDLGQVRPSREKDSGLELPYRLDTVNADEDLPELVAALKRSPRARLCLYGPPGTGKTRFVRYLADTCRLKLHEYRASDLLDKYLGESEQNIRRMFEACDKPGRLLFLDEADSLVGDRSGAHQRWEVSQVNELLKGLEGFDGLFVASTNLMGRLDPAVMRRLDFKIHFGWLQPDQRWRLFLDLARQGNVSVRGLVARRLRQRLDGMRCLTPGDFALLARRVAIRPVADAHALADLLEQETRHKPEIRAESGIGFTARLDRKVAHK